MFSIGRNSEKRRLLNLSNKFKNKEFLTPQELKDIIEFKYIHKRNSFNEFIKKITLGISLLLGALIAVYPDFFEKVANSLPSWTNLSPRLVTGLDYLWNIVGEPVGKSNIIYHLPNIILYAFGFFGIKALFNAINKIKWQDIVLNTKAKVVQQIEEGNLKINLEKGFSLLFIGDGDFIGEEFYKTSNINSCLIVSSKKPNYTNIWNKYSIDNLSSNLYKLFEETNLEKAGEYIFFPVKDEQIFLPSLEAYDLSPYKLEIIIKNLRANEKERNLVSKKIIIIGDKFQKSLIRSDDHQGKVDNSEEEISIRSIAGNYENCVVIDPSELVLREIFIRSQNKKIIFRSSVEGILEYKSRFYYRLGLLGYDPAKTLKEEFIVGYDIFEDKIEHQSLNRKFLNYFPVVLSRNVYEALLKNGYRESEILYVPNIVLRELTRRVE